MGGRPWPGLNNAQNSLGNEGRARRTAHTDARRTRMKAVFKAAWPYSEDVLNLPVADVESAVPFYETIMGFTVVSRKDSPCKSTVLTRDSIRIGLAENGGDPSQEGCFFEVDDVEAAFREIKGTPPTESSFRVDPFDGVPYRVFFQVAPDGLCYMFGQRQGP